MYNSKKMIALVLNHLILTCNLSSFSLPDFTWKAKESLRVEDFRITLHSS